MRTDFEIQHQGFKGYPYNAEHEGVVEVIPQRCCSSVINRDERVCFDDTTVI